MQLRVIITIDEVEGVDTEAVKTYFDNAVGGLPRRIIDSIQGGWNVGVTEISSGDSEV